MRRGKTKKGLCKASELCLSSVLKRHLMNFFPLLCRSVCCGRCNISLLWHFPQTFFPYLSRRSCCVGSLLDPFDIHIENWHAADDGRKNLCVYILYKIHEFSRLLCVENEQNLIWNLWNLLMTTHKAAKQEFSAFQSNEPNRAWGYEWVDLWSSNSIGLWKREREAREGKWKVLKQVNFICWFFPISLGTLFSHGSTAAAAAKAQKDRQNPSVERFSLFFLQAQWKSAKTRTRWR